MVHMIKISLILLFEVVDQSLTTKQNLNFLKSFTVLNYFLTPYFQCASFPMKVSSKHAYDQH